MLNSGAVTWIVDRLERMGYVRRERDLVDRRKVILHPIWTAEREEALGRIFAPLLIGVKEDVAGYGEDQLALIVDFMAQHARTPQRVTAEVRKAYEPAT